MSTFFGLTPYTKSGCMCTKTPDLQQVKAVLTRREKCSLGVHARDQLTLKGFIGQANKLPSLYPLVPNTAAQDIVCMLLWQFYSVSEDTGELRGMVVVVVRGGMGRGGVRIYCNV